MGIIARFTTVTLTGIVGRRGGADFEQAANTHSARAPVQAEYFRMLMVES